jgi:DNA-binding LacI/PurR family transcriptional regulator
MVGTTDTGRRPATIRDVARRAGVSIATVSRVLNDAGEVSVATTATVRQAVEDLGFRPSRAGRLLKTSRSHLIAVIVDAPLERAAAALAGAERAARAAGYAVLLAVADDDAARQEAVTAARAHGADGIVVLTVAASSIDPGPVATAEPAGGADAGAAAVAALLSRLPG